MSWARICRLLGLAALAVFLTSAFTPLPNLLSRWLTIPRRLEPAEAIVVLGTRLTADWELSAASLYRTRYGIVLYRRGLAPLLVFTGPARGEGPAEATVRAELARELGIPAEVILTEAGAKTTREEAIRVGALLRPRGIRKILLVTNSLHMARARGLFERGGFEVLAAPTDDVSKASGEPEDRLQLMRQILGELIAQLYYRVAGYL
ncbi:MAG: YdcF family protein [candidate division NC10 bacterium]|nr:YdcF family protein [candidate division NC10 bacterium]